MQIWQGHRLIFIAFLFPQCLMRHQTGKKVSTFSYCCLLTDLLKLLMVMLEKLKNGACCEQEKKDS